MAATIPPETVATLPRGPLDMLSESRLDVVSGGDVEDDGIEPASAEMKEEDEGGEDEERGNLDEEGGARDPRVVGAGAARS